MLDRILDFFDQHMGGANAARSSVGDERALRLASCALLVEMVRIDSEDVPIEREVLVGAIANQHGLSQSDAEELMSMADEELARSTDYFQFTSLINRHYTQPQKIAVIEAMWQIAFADTRLDAHERHLIRKIGSLLHVTDNDLIAARDRARARLEARR